jgi:hypothetical protein
MRLSLRKSEPDFNSETKQDFKHEEQDRVDKSDANMAKFKFSLKEDLELCRKSLR